MFGGWEDYEARAIIICRGQSSIRLTITNAPNQSHARMSMQAPSIEVRQYRVTLDAKKPSLKGPSPSPQYYQMTRNLIINVRVPDMRKGWVLPVWPWTEDG